MRTTPRKSRRTSDSKVGKPPPPLAILNQGDRCHPALRGRREAGPRSEDDRHAGKGPGARRLRYLRLRLLPGRAGLQGRQPEHDPEDDVFALSDSIIVSRVTIDRTPVDC